MTRQLRAAQIDARMAQTQQTDELMLLQSCLRADVVVMDVDIHSAEDRDMLQALEGDAHRPHLMVCMRNADRWSADRARMLGAGEVLPDTVDDGFLCGRIVQAVSRRRDRQQALDHAVPQAMDELFAENGVSSSMRGHRFLLQMLDMLLGDSYLPGKLTVLCQRVARQSGCSSTLVERNVRYVIRQCERGTQRPVGEPAPFLRRLMNELKGVGEYCPTPTRMSIFSEGRRLFV